VVARLVAIAVVQLLEAIEVGEHDGEGRPPGLEGPRPLLEHAPVGEAGERVRGRLELRLRQGPHHGETLAHLRSHHA
jgi:hypothetical protein